MKKLYFSDKDFFIKGRLDRLFLGMSLEKSKQILIEPEECVIDDYTSILKYGGLEFHFSALSSNTQELVNIYADDFSIFENHSFSHVDFHPFFFQKGIPTLRDFLEYCEAENLSFALAQDWEGQMLLLFIEKSQVSLYFEYENPLPTLYQDLKENKELLLSAFSKTSLHSFDNMYSHLLFSTMPREKNSLMNLEMALQALLENPFRYLNEKNMSHLLSFLKSFEAIKKKELQTREKDLLSLFQHICMKKLETEETWEAVLREMLEYFS